MIYIKLYKLPLKKIIYPSIRSFTMKLVNQRFLMYIYLYVYMHIYIYNIYIYIYIYMHTDSKSG